MSTINETKINLLLQQIPHGTIVLASWLLKQGYSRDLQHRYIKSKWLEPIGVGAFKRTNEHVDLYGALYAFRFLDKSDIHIGGRSSLLLKGFSHFLEMNPDDVQIFASNKKNIPKWFSGYNWRPTPRLFQSNILPCEMGLDEHSFQTFKLKISSPARALIECLELFPLYFDLNEASQIMEGLNSLRPDNVQTLLENCNSIKVKRLFMFLASKSGHTWYRYLNPEKINLGSGKRSLVKNGIWIPEFKITVPKNLD